MNSNSTFVFVIILILIFLNITIKQDFCIVGNKMRFWENLFYNYTFIQENYENLTNKYNIIIINHKKYHIVIIKNINNVQDKIYKIYKN